LLNLSEIQIFHFCSGVTSSFAANAGVLRIVVAGLTLEGKLLWVRVKSFAMVALRVNLLSRQLPNQSSTVVVNLLLS
jgi:hypothetical protein